MLLTSEPKCIIIFSSQGYLLGRALGKVNTLLDKRSPFANIGSDGTPNAVVALEVEWSSVAGIDFLFPLHQVRHFEIRELEN